MEEGAAIAATTATAPQQQREGGPGAAGEAGGGGSSSSSSSSSSRLLATAKPLLWTALCFGLLLIAVVLSGADAKHLRGAADAADGGKAVEPAVAATEGGDSPPPPPLPAAVARNKTTATLPNFPHKVGRVLVPHAERGMTLSRIAYGSLHFPEFEDDVEGLYRNLLTCLRLGITTVDLSDVYGWYQDGHGKSNDIFAEVLRAHPDLRPRLELVAKFGIRLSGGYHVDLSPEWIEESIDRYLKLFNIKQLDVFMIHNPDPNMDVDAIAKAFKEIKQKRKAKAFGISNFHQWEYEALRDAMAKEGLKLSVHEMETSVLHPDKIADGTVDYFSSGENDLAILGWGPLGGDPNGGKNLLFGSNGGRERRIVEALTDKGEQLAMALDNVQGKKEVRGLRADEVAVAWLLYHPGNIIPIIGTTLVNRIVDQSRPPEMVTMSEADFEEIMEAVHY